MNWGRLAAPNYRGAPLPRVLGAVLVASGVAGAIVVAGYRGLAAPGWSVVPASALVFAAGLIDDLVPIGPRGLRNHLRSLLSGHMTTGILKAIVILACSVIVVALQPIHEGWVRVAGVVLVAGCANLWNGLDVAPGRALKAFLPAAIAAGTADWRLIPTLPGMLMCGLPIALFLDLRERAMLGDGGSNLLGFTAGLGLYLALPGWGVGIGGALTVALNVAAETVTLTRLIEAVPPLRWADALGRLSVET